MNDDINAQIDAALAKGKVVESMPNRAARRQAAKVLLTRKQRIQSKQRSEERAGW